MAVRLIINGKKAGDEQLRAAVKQLRDEGHTIEPRVTYEFGDTGRLAREAMEEKADIVAIAGGDGSINELVDGMMQANTNPSCAVGVVPFGTANDFAVGAGIPTGDPLAALRLILDTAATPIDVGKCNGRHFVNVASGGFGARVTATTPVGMKNALGGAAYSLMGLVTALKMSPYHVRLITGGGEEFQGELFVVAVGNGRQAGGGYQVAPHAILNDGLLDVLGIVDVDMSQIGTVFSELSDVSALGNRCVRYLKLDRFRLESDQPLHMNLDGEPTVDTTFEFSVVPRSLRMILPSSAPVEKQQGTT